MKYRIYGQYTGNTGDKSDGIPWLFIAIRASCSWINRRKSKKAYIRAMSASWQILLSSEMRRQEDFFVILPITPGQNFRSVQPGTGGVAARRRKEHLGIYENLCVNGKNFWTEKIRKQRNQHGYLRVQRGVLWCDIKRREKQLRKCFVTAKLFSLAVYWTPPVYALC